MNLVINGGEAIGEKQGTVSVSLETAAMTSDELAVYGRITNTRLSEGTYVKLDVSDNGVGMNHETINKIFDPFFTTKFTGRGLGLSAVLGIIRGHEGGITLESTECRGTTFRIVLPACPAPKRYESTAPDDAARTHPISTTVLVIDDEPDVATTAKEMLEMGTYQTLVATNPVDGVELFRQSHARVGLVLLDLTMPEMSGKEGVEALQAIDPAVRIIISSGYTEEEVAKRIGALSVAAFIQKPYRLSSFLSIVDNVLRGT